MEIAKFFQILVATSKKEKANRVALAEHLLLGEREKGLSGEACHAATRNCWHLLSDMESAHQWGKKRGGVGKFRDWVGRWVLRTNEVNVVPWFSVTRSKSRPWAQIVPTAACSGEVTHWPLCCDMWIIWPSQKALCGLNKGKYDIFCVFSSCYTFMETFKYWIITTTTTKSRQSWRIHVSESFWGKGANLTKKS